MRGSRTNYRPRWRDMPRLAGLEPDGPAFWLEPGNDDPDPEDVLNLYREFGPPPWPRAPRPTPPRWRDPREHQPPIFGPQRIPPNVPPWPDFWRPLPGAPRLEEVPSPDTPGDYEEPGPEVRTQRRPHWTSAALNDAISVAEWMSARRRQLGPGRG